MLLVSNHSYAIRWRINQKFCWFKIFNADSTFSNYKNPPARIEMLERPWDRDLRSWTFNQGRFHSTIAIWFIVLTIKYGRIGFHATSIMWYMPYFAFLMETRNWRAWIFIPWGSVPYNKCLKSDWMWLFKPIIDTICLLPSNTKHTMRYI